jgi:hypothetical protein
MRRKTGIVLFVWMCCCAGIYAQDNGMLPAVREPAIAFNPPHYVCRKTKIPFPGEPDGRLDKAFWQPAETIDDFHDIEGDTRPKPFKKTMVKMLWDDNYLYVGAQLEEDEIWATVSGRDEVMFIDNDFELFLSPKHTSHRYYELEMNAMNAVWDLLMDKPGRDGVRRINSWDIRGLKSAVYMDGELNNPSATNRFWSLELLIPWFPLRETTPSECLPEHVIPDIGEIWRMNLFRVEYTVDAVDGKYVKRINPATNRPFPGYNWVWAPIGVKDIHMPEMWGYLMFGDENTRFAMPENAQIEWELRKLYYRQRQFGVANGFYTTDFEQLKRQDTWSSPPRIHVTPHLFEISMPTPAGGRLHIRQDGYLW